MDVFSVIIAVALLIVPIWMVRIIKVAMSPGGKMSPPARIVFGLFILLPVGLFMLMGVVPYYIGIVGASWNSQDFMTTKRNLGIVFSLAGLWLGGSGVLGEDRLERWDGFIKTWIKIERENGLRRLRRFSHRFTDRSTADEFLRRLFIIIFLIWLCVLFAGQFFEENMALSSITPVLLCIMTIGLFVAFLFLSIIPSLISGVLFLLEIPYRLVASIENKNSLNRTLLFLALIFGSLGIIFLEF